MRPSKIKGGIQFPRLGELGLGSVAQQGAEGEEGEKDFCIHGLIWLSKKVIEKGYRKYKENNIKTTGRIMIMENLIYMIKAPVPKIGIRPCSAFF